MRRLSLWIAALSLATTTTAFAQQVQVRANRQALDKIASAASKDYKANRGKALKLAKARGWEIEKTYPDGRHISLQGVDSKGMPIYYITYNNTRAAATTRTNQLWAGGSLGLALSGSGNAVTERLAVWDGGRVLATHQELEGRVVQKDNPPQLSDHATHVAGTMMASGVNPLAKGMSFGLKKLQAYDFNNDAAEIALAAKDLLISNHSYGTVSGWRYNTSRKGGTSDPYWEWWGDVNISPNEDYKFGYYDQTTSNWDKIAFEAPYYLMVKSAGNNRNESGPAVGQPYYQRNSSTGAFELSNSRPANISSNNSYDIISTYGTAKNILTVAAVEPISYDYQQPSDVRVSSFSSYGPTDDGRIKPDIAGNGVNLVSSLSSGNKAYGNMSGTSMSAPNVSGSLLLLQEHYANLNNNNVMRAATLKGLVLQTADEAGQYPGPDYIYGWGLLNTERAASAISNLDRNHLIQERQLQQDGFYEFDVVASGRGPLKVTIAWTDPEAAALPLNNAVLNNRTPRLVNDLDLRITGNGTTYMPWILDPNQPANAATTGDNILDNVEQVLIANAVPGKTYRIRISHKRNLSRGPQAYSIIASGIGGATYCTSAPTSDQGASIESVAVNGVTIAPQTPATCTTYRDLTENIFTLEAGQSKSIAIKTGTCTTDASKIAKVYIDWNGNGSFDDAGEQAAVSGAVTGNVTITETITAPANVTPGNKVRMRIILAETTNAATITSCGNYTAGETQDYLVQLGKAQNDVAALKVNLTGSQNCATPSQSVTVTLKNNGAAAQSNIPVTVRVRKNGADHLQLNGTYKSSLGPAREAEMLFNFATEAGATYEVTAVTSLQGDVLTTNNETSYSFTVPGVEPAPQASIQRCGNDPNYSFTGSGNGTVFWYNSATSQTPLAAGNQFLYPASQVGQTMYASLNDFSATIGYANKSVLPEGGYNQFSPDVLIKTFAPVVLEQARLYIGHGGKIIFTAYDMNGVAVSARELEVKATRSTEAKGVQPNDPNDQGQIYYLGLELPAAGDYRIVINYEDDATIYRNNLAQVPYPLGIKDVFQITGNSATSSSETYYYYFYDLKVKALGCKSERVAVDIKGSVPLDQPVVSRKGKTLHSSAPAGNQWFFEGNLIAGATGQTLEPKESGYYTVRIQDNGCLSEMAQAYKFIYNGELPAGGEELIAYRNPNSDGLFKVEGELKLDDVVTFTVHDMLGNKLWTSSVKDNNGQYETTIDLSKAASGMYLLRIQKNDEVTVKRLVIQR